MCVEREKYETGRRESLNPKPVKLNKWRHEGVLSEIAEVAPLFRQAAALIVFLLYCALAFDDGLVISYHTVAPLATMRLNKLLEMPVSTRISCSQSNPAPIHHSERAML